MAVYDSIMRALLYGASLTLLYTLYGIYYRLYLSPLSKYPGPKLAALTSWYEFYFDIVQYGRFPWEVQRLHDIYGPVIRISPTEIHVRDPDFFNELMTTSSRPRDKTEFLAGLLGQKSIFGTVPHELHRLRRSALDSYYSKKSVTAVEPLVQGKVDELCDRLSEYVGTQDVVSLNAAFTALALDVVSEHAFGRTYGLLKKPGFDPEWYLMLYKTMEMFPLARCLLWLPAIVKRIPPKMRNWLNKELAFSWNLEAEIRSNVNEVKRNYGAGQTKKSLHKSVFEELLDSDLPPEEKTVDRLSDEGFIIIIAGGDVSAQNLAMLSYELLTHPEILKTLKNELHQARAGSNARLTWQELEQLPFLRACILEGLRFNSVPTARNIRVAPYETLYCGDWVIEPGTPIGIDAHFAQLDPNVYPEPNKFNPYRWLEPTPLTERQRMEKHFHPFGKGSRICVGMNLAYCELFLTVANVFSRFDFELFDTTPDDVTLVCNALVGHPRKDSRGIRVKVTRCVDS